jgi:hypothetical protein
MFWSESWRKHKREVQEHQENADQKAWWTERLVATTTSQMFLKQLMTLGDIQEETE